MPRSSGTHLERALEHALLDRGLVPVRQHPWLADKRRTIDLAFLREKVAVFADGCYWHACPAHGGSPLRNQSYWDDAREARRAADVDTDTQLGAQGWAVVRVWEHENPIDAARAISDLVRARRHALSRLWQPR